MTNRAISASGLAYITLFAAVGCAGPADASPDAWTVTDSAGVRIVDNHQAEWTSETAWTVSAIPLFSANDALDDPNPLVVPADAIRLNDGRIAVADVGGHVIAVYDANGQRLAHIGGEHIRTLCTQPGSGDCRRLVGHWYDESHGTRDD